MYAIYVRDLPGDEPIDITTLAVDVPDAATASNLVRSIATSYPVHLSNPFDTAYWFQDQAGCHEIWYENVEARSEANRVSPEPSVLPVQKLLRVVQRQAEPLRYEERRLRRAA